MIERVKEANTSLEAIAFRCGSLKELIERPARVPRQALRRIRIDPTDPCIFQLSGGTTGIPKLIPRTHNDYAYNSKAASAVCGVTGEFGPAARAADRAQPAAGLPGYPGLFLRRRQGGALADDQPEEMLALIEKHRVDAPQGRARASDPADQRAIDRRIRSVELAGHPERRPAHAAGSAAPDAASSSRAPSCRKISACPKAC